MSGAELEGIDEFLKKLESKFGTSKVNRAVNKTLNSAGEKAEQELKSAVSSFRKTGKTVEEVTHSKPKKSLGETSVTVGWSGDSSRWRLEHLNEFGFTRSGKFVRPRGFGVVQGFVDKQKNEYVNEVRKGLKDLL